MKLEELENLRLDRLTIGLLFSNLRRFVDYCESNLEWQHRVRIQKLWVEVGKCDPAVMPPEFYRQAEGDLSADYEFVIPNLVRYSSLVFLVTYVEWFLVFCERYSYEMNWGEPPPPGKKKTLRKIEWLRSRQRLRFSHPFDCDIEALIVLRNCIVHDAAIVDDTNEHQKRAVEQLDGVNLGKFLYMRNLITLDKGVIERFTTQTEEWMNSFMDYLDIGDRIPHDIVID